MAPTVAVVVLNWNGRRDTLACLASLSQLNCPVVRIVVDNGSTDGSVSSIRKEFPSVIVIEIPQNLGYTGGNNVGLERALAEGVDYVLLLNNDTKVAPDLVRLLVDAAEKDPSVGIAGPTIYYYDDPETIWSAGGAIDWDRGSTSMVGLNERDEGQFSIASREVNFVTGCAMLVKRSVLEKVGLLDDRFFAYYEDAEWCVRARRAGFKIVHVPTAKVWHKISPEAQTDSPTVLYYMARNRLLFLRTIGASPRVWIRALASDYLRPLISWSLRPKWRGKRWRRRVTALALADAFRGRWGRCCAPIVSGTSRSIGEH